MPAGVFALLFGRVENVMAMNGLSMMRAVAQAIGVSFGGNDGRVQQALRDLSDQALGR